jgi:hypothetical protein
LWHTKGKPIISCLYPYIASPPGQGEGRSSIDEIERQIEREQEVSHLPQAEYNFERARRNFERVL